MSETEQKQQQPQKKSGGGGGGGKKGGERKDLFSAENVASEAKTIIAMARETDFLVTGVPNIDGTYEERKEGERQNEVPVAVMEALADQIAAAAPTTSFMLIAVGPSDAPPKRCSILVRSTTPKLSPTDWLIACNATDALYGTPAAAFGYFVAEYPIKAKDTVSGMAFAYLRKTKLLQDDCSDDERPAFDINADN